MIHINLLPAELIPKQRNIAPYVAVGVFAIVGTLFLMFSFLGVQRMRAEKLGQRVQLENELRSYDDEIAAVEKLRARDAQLSEKEEAIDQITAGRTVWSHEMLELAGLVPERIWLSEMRLSERRRAVEVEKPNPNRSAGAPPTIKTTEIRSFPALAFTGYALSPYREEGVSLVGAFIQNMKDDTEFSLHFVEPEMKTIERDEFADEVVMRFTMDVELGSGT